MGDFVLRRFSSFILLVGSLACVLVLQGCMAAPVVGLANMARNGPITMKIEGKGDMLQAFKRAAIDSGGTVPRIGDGYAEAQFATVAVQATLQEVVPGKANISVTTLGAAARSWDFQDSIAKVADTLSAGMNKAGFTLVERKRDSGI